MNRSNRELWYALAGVLLITLIYLLMVVRMEGAPASSEFFGHSIGILGFTLMLMTETLYSIRKRSRAARWGRMSDWLSFHIFTGIVGPYMVLLHTAWKFNGLAGMVTLLTFIVVVSGFIGRYIYTLVPRSIDGAIIEAEVLAGEIAKTEEELTVILEKQRTVPSRLVYAAAYGGAGRGLLQASSSLIGRLRWGVIRRRARPEERARMDRMNKLLSRKRTLQRQQSSLATARRLLALWHSVHIPLGMALFTAAFIHIGAAIYYATLLR